MGKISRLISVAIGCLLAAAAVAVGAKPAGAGEASCIERTERRSARSFAATLRCLVREKRSGSIDSACRSRAAATMTRATRRRGACGDMSAARAKVERCKQAVLEHISENGPCAAKKMRAVLKSLPYKKGAGRSTELCRAFERAGSCAGDCLAVDEALASCWFGAGPARTLPEAAPDDQVILFGAYEGDAISSTTIAGQDEVTVTARVVIEPGATPLYVILTSSEQMIWRFEGAVSRVRHVVLLGSGPRGVTGVDVERVADLTGTSGGLSGYFYSAGSPEAAALRAAVENALGRPVDVMAGSYSVGTLFLPAATVTGTVPPDSVPPGFDPAVYQELGLRFSPGGVVDIDPATVVSITPAEPYEVLPQGFGLAQLVATGALERRGGFFFFDGYFYIASAIPRFPAGLYGGHLVFFVLGTGVPMPAGDPGHSCVISEETGLPLANELICGFYEPPDVTCNLPEAAEGDQIVLVGAYEADAISTVTIVGQDDDTQTVRVVIDEGATPLYVVLASYENIIWRFEGATSRIGRLVLAGYGAQGVTGLPAEVVTSLSRSGDCPIYFYDIQSPEGVAARRAVEDALGRPVDVMAGSYSVGTLSLPAATVTGTVPPDSVPPGFDPSVYRELGLRFSPGGVVDVDPATVVSITPAEPYEVLPQGFGLAQLVATGALEHRGGFFFFDGYFYIASAIPRFPARLTGAHFVFFVLGTGVPMPAGDPGHSCVISEETGLPLANDLICSLFPGLGG
jgi:hypothetical protein